MKKSARILSLFLVCVLVVGMSCGLASAAELRYYTYGTVTTNVNLRSQPEINSSNILGVLVTGVSVRILQELSGDGITWYKVYVASGANVNKTGYVSTGCVVLD